MASKLEINIRSLISHCEELAKEDTKNWSLRESVKSLDTMIKATSEDKPNRSILDEYYNRCDKLKTTINNVERSFDSTMNGEQPFDDDDIHLLLHLRGGVKRSSNYYSVNSVSSDEAEPPTGGVSIKPASNEAEVKAEVLRIIKAAAVETKFNGVEVIQEILTELRSEVDGGGERQNLSFWAEIKRIFDRLGTTTSSDLKTMIFEHKRLA